MQEEYMFKPINDTKLYTLKELLKIRKQVYHKQINVINTVTKQIWTLPFRTVLKKFG
jgi:hypothetical protein